MGNRAPANAASDGGLRPRGPQAAADKYRFAPVSGNPYKRRSTCHFHDRAEPSPMSATMILIPARMASTRLPGKPLADIAGEPMIVHVWRRAQEAERRPGRGRDRRAKQSRRRSRRRAAAR